MVFYIVTSLPVQKRILEDWIPYFRQINSARNHELPLSPESIEFFLKFFLQLKLLNKISYFKSRSTSMLYKHQIAL